MKKTYPVINTKFKGFDLKCCENINLCFKFEESNRILIQGYAKTREGEYLLNAGVEIIKINNITNQAKVLGVVFTDSNGKYAVSLQVCKFHSYKFNIYSPAN